jgi:hypothetical protein
MRLYWQALFAAALLGALPPCANAVASYYRAPEERAYAEAPVAPRSGVWYEIFVRAWYDTVGDGIGDLNGAALVSDPRAQGVARRTTQT